MYDIVFFATYIYIAISNLQMRLFVRSSNVEKFLITNILNKL